MAQTCVTTPYWEHGTNLFQNPPIGNITQICVKTLIGNMAQMCVKTPYWEHGTNLCQNPYWEHGTNLCQNPLLSLNYPVSYTHLRAHETPEHLVCRLLLEK